MGPERYLAIGDSCKGLRSVDGFLAADGLEPNVLSYLCRKWLAYYDTQDTCTDCDGRRESGGRG